MILCPVQGPCRLVQHFGQRPETYKPFGVLGHPGVDITGPTPGVSVPVFAPVEGLVAQVASNDGYGNFVVLRTPADVAGRQKQLLLGHFASVQVKAGQWVNLSDPLGMMGKTGFADGLHCHLGLQYVLNNTVLNHDNGYNGFVDFERYLRFWGDPTVLHLVSYPYG
jgi:murein DD-endopeptidase MepM/ murein hydrolase activator NlpD